MPANAFVTSRWQPSLRQPWQHTARVVHLLNNTVAGTVTVSAVLKISLGQHYVLLTFVGGVSSDVSRSSCTTSFTPCCSIFSQCYVFFQGCPCPLLDVIDVLHPGVPPSSFPGIIPRMHVFLDCTLFLHACPKKAIFLLIIWARSSRLV